MEEAGRMQIGSNNSNSYSSGVSATVSKVLDWNVDSENVNGVLSGKTCSPPASKTPLRMENGGQNGDADVRFCSKGHICRKCCYSYYGCSSIFYGARDDCFPQTSSSFAKKQSNFRKETVTDEAGSDTSGNWWLGSYHY